MKICAHNPAQPEFSLCGIAQDAPYTEEDVEDFKLADEEGVNVTCSECRSILADLFETYTKTGRLKTWR